MIQINKSPYPEFIEYVKKNKPQNWSELDLEVRTNARKYILEEEQHNQCAYTELPLKYENNDSHIEHLKRKNAAFFPRLEFEWSNLFVSCNSDDFGGKYKDEKYLKGKTKTENELIINPALENPSEYFELTEWGELDVKDDLPDLKRKRAEVTRDAFNLNDPSLKKRRRETIQAVRDYQSGGIDKDMVKEFLSDWGFKSVIDYELNN
ncbi:MAG: TIGR02646 family protein [Chloroflexia bacterium]|nr:TIGR02646 family protein [Chloroflexia bacterium]